MGGVKETLCSRCDRRKVCKYTDKFVALVSTTDRIPTENIHKIELKCTEFRQVQGNIRSY